MSEKLKKLISKNPQDFEGVAKELIETCNTELFKELVEQEDFLFDFVKQNVAKRLEKYINQSNYMNLIEFLKYYSPSYEEFIITNLAEYANEDLTDLMLDKFENGSIDEKIYSAKYFSYIKDPLSLEFLNKYAFCEDSTLSSNCAQTLAYMNETDAYNKALTMLNADDDFTKLDGVKFLISYGDKKALPNIIATMKSSSMGENIASEIPYLCDLFELYKINPSDTLLCANFITNSLGEITPLSSVFDYRLYEFFEMLINSDCNSKIAAVLLNANDKFNTLTENNEYLYDETKDTKNEINDIKSLLQNTDFGKLYSIIDNELNPNSPFVFTALEYTENEDMVRNLLTCSNPAIIIRAVEILKQMETLSNNDRNAAIENIKDENLKNVILSI